jgi:hypothetical protein
MGFSLVLYPRLGEEVVHSLLAEGEADVTIPSETLRTEEQPARPVLQQVGSDQSAEPCSE